MSKQTLIVNLLAGPGSGKSTMAAAIFSELKYLGVDCELAPEYAKDLTWEKRHKTFENQIYLFGKQHHRIYRLVGQVDVVITDSPILLTPIYDGEGRSELRQLVLSEYKKVQNYNVFVKRKKDFNPNGRNHTENEAIEIDKTIKFFLKNYNIPFQELDGTKESVQHVIRVIYEQKGWSNTF